jgi:hypothetical protein
MIFSYSRLSLYETCPKRFYYKYILKLEESKITKPLALGKAVHKSIEAFINGMPLKEAIFEGYSECDFHPAVSISEIAELVKRAPVTKNMGETEVYFRLPLFNSPNAPKFQGYIDLVQGNRLKDWKTNWKSYAVNDNHQVGLYAWAISKLKKYEFVEGSLYFLRFKQESKYFFNKNDMDRSRKWALELANEINFKREMLDLLPEQANDLFPIKPSSACSHCPFAFECYLDNQTELKRSGKL